MWNRPLSDADAANKTGGIKRKDANFCSWRIFAVGGVVVGAVIAAWLLWPTGQSGRKGGRGETVAKHRIKEVAPSIGTNRVKVAEAPVAGGVDTNARPTRVGERLNGYVMAPDGTIEKLSPNYHPTMTTPDWCAIFDHPAENTIATLVSLAPGEGIVGSPECDGEFTKSFLESLKTPIIPTTDDPDHIKELKKAVNKAKIELKAAYDRGEDIEKIIADTYTEFQKLEQYKLDIESDVLDSNEDETKSDEDAEDFLKAANMLLESKGIEPLKDTVFIRIKHEFDENMKGNQQ